MKGTIVRVCAWFTLAIFSLMTFGAFIFKEHVADYKNRINKPETEHHLYFDQVAKRGELDYQSSLVYGWFTE
jgi:hypothetical protein